MRIICLGFLIALNILFLNSSLAHADYHLIKSEVAPQQRAQWRDLNVEKGEASYIEDNRKVYYRWNVPKSIGPNGAPLEISAESLPFKNYNEVYMRADATFGASFTGDLNTLIRFKDEDPSKLTKQSRSGLIMPPPRADEFEVRVRISGPDGPDATVVAYIYSNKAAPTPPPSTTNVTISADLKTNVLQLKSSETVTGTLNVDVSGLPENKGELEFSAFLTTYGLTDIIDDFGANYMKYLTDKEFGGTYTNERVKYRTTAYLHANAYNGTNTYNFEETVPVKIPAGLDEGQYLLIVFVRVKGTQVFTTTRAGVDLANTPKRILLTAPAKVSPQEGFQGENFYLELKYAVEGIAQDETVNLRVRGNLTGPEQMGVAEKTLMLGNTERMGNNIYKKSGEATIATDDVKDAGEYIWNYTIYAGGGFAPYDGQIKFKVNAGVGGMDQPVPAGRVRIEGLGKVGQLQINDGSGWKRVSEGFLLSLTDPSTRVRIRTDVDQPTLVFPNGRKIIVRPDTEMSLQGDQGDTSLTYGEVKVFGPNDKTKKIKVGTMGGIVIEEEGTIFTVTYDPKAKTTTIAVEEGVVIATPQSPNMKPVRVKAGDKVTIGDVVDVAAQDPSDNTRIIDTVSPAAGAEATPDGKAFENRVRHLFNSQNIADNIAYDTFAAMSLIIVKRALPGSCYQNDPYVSYPTWDAHRKYAIERGRSKSAENLIWKTGATLACLSNQADKDALIAELNEVLRQAENGSVTRISDPAPAPAAANGAINIQSATYGGNCKAAAGNVTAHAQQACNGKTLCDYKVDYTVIGDPAPGCAKDYVMAWTCGSSSQVNSQTVPGEAGWGSIVKVECSAVSGTQPSSPSLTTAAQNSVEASNVPGLWSWDWASSGEPIDYGATITYNTDGTVVSSYSGYTGVWKMDNGFVLVDWTSQPGANAKLWFTADPNVMEGKNEKNFPIRSKKRISFFIEKHPAQASNIPGIWKWDWNKAGEPVDQGASATFNTDGTMTTTYAGSYGTWTIKDGKLQLQWTHSGESNTLYPTADPNVMEGTSQYGARIRMTKKEALGAQNPAYEYGIDRQGWDYTHFALSAPNPDLCASRCQQESQCRAWTYVKPGFQGPEPMCWLKNSVPPQIKGADFAVSGVVRP